MFRGARVDDALSAYHRRILAEGDRLAPDQFLRSEGYSRRLIA
jgi:hypothetical protein